VTTSVYTEEKMSFRVTIVIVEFEVPKRYILRFILFTDMVQRVLQWERKKRFEVVEFLGPNS
jgi:hypothetical protein